MLHILGAPNIYAKSNERYCRKMNRAHACDIYKKCGGCQLTNMSYQEQLSYKMRRVIALLGRFSRVDEIIGMENPLHYRNKMQAAFALDKRGRTISGVWQSKDCRVAKTDACLIEDEVSLWIVRAARGLLPEYNISVYNSKNGRGMLRHIMVRRAHVTGEIMVVLVTTSLKIPGGEAFAEALVRRFPHIRTVVQCINNTDTPLWMEEEQIVLYGDGYIEDVLCGCYFHISPRSFYQVNSVQTEILYNKALDFARLRGTENVIDAYCGIGTIGIIAAAEAQHVIGIESNADAVKNAIENCRLNHTGNYRVYKGDAGSVMAALTRAGRQVDVVFADPPRAGCSRAFIDAVLQTAPEKMVYISCNPETLARDLSILVKGKYTVKKIQPVDMFPHTKHVETVVMLSHKKPIA